MFGGIEAVGVGAEPVMGVGHSQPRKREACLGMESVQDNTKRKYLRLMPGVSHKDLKDSK